MNSLGKLLRGETQNQRLSVFVTTRTWEHTESLKGVEILNTRHKISQLLRASISHNA